MPGHRLHRLVDRLFLGREYPLVHRLADYPYRLLGPRHRILFHNERIHPLLTAVLLGDIDAGISHYLHIRLDKLWSRDRRLRILLMLLEKTLA